LGFVAEVEAAKAGPSAAALCDVAYSGGKGVAEVGVDRRHAPGKRNL